MYFARWIAELWLLRFVERKACDGERRPCAKNEGSYARSASLIGLAGSNAVEG